MSRIVRVEGRGWMGRDFVVDLAGPTINIGPNGSGKSMVLGAVKYDLTGEAPSGRDAVHVAQHFSPKGGSVIVTDETGAWIERGLTVSGKGTKAILRTSRDKETLDLRDWQDVVLGFDVEAFLALSRGERLGAVGAILHTDEGATMEALDGGVARAIAGSGAGPQTIHDPEARKHLEKEKIREVDLWLRELRREAEAIIQEGWPKVVDWFHRRKLDAVRDNKHETDAADVLSKESMGADAAADELAARRKDEAKARAELRDAELDHAGAVEAAKRIPGAARQIDTGRHDREYAEKALAEIEDAPHCSPEDLTLAQDTAKEAERKLVEAKATVGKRALHAQKISGERETMARLNASPAGKLMTAIAGVPDEAHPSIPEVRRLVGILSEQTVAGISEAEKRLVFAEKAFEALPEVTEAQIQELQHNLDLARGLLKVVEGSLAEAARVASKRRDCEAEIARASKREAEGRASLAEAQKALAEYGGSPEEIAAEVRACRENATKAAAALALAQESMGKIEAYRGALERAERAAEIGALAAKVEVAAQVLRDSSAGDAAKALEGEMEEILRACGRDETPKVNLDRTKGRASFDMGWIRDGVSVALEAVSGGEAALLMLALSLAYLRQVEGRRVLLLELDALDPYRLRETMRGLATYAGELDCILAATHLAIPDVKNWTVRRCGT